MKKKIVCILIACTLLTGCGTKVVNDHGDTVHQYGRFIEIEGTTEKYNGKTQRLLYDEDTKIIYIYTEGMYSYNLCPYYCMNIDNKPVIAVYNAEED